MRIKNENGYTLIELMIVIMIGAIVTTAVSIAVFKMRSDVEYDNILTKVVEQVDLARVKALSGKLSGGTNHVPYGVKFSGDKIIQFEGETYIENASSNVVYQLPVGYGQNITCSPLNNGIILFSPIKGENSNMCTIQITAYGSTNVKGTVYIGKYGIQLL